MKPKIGALRTSRSGRPLLVVLECAPILGSKNLGEVMTRTTILKTLAIGTAAVLASCDTTSSLPYQPSIQNVMEFRSALGPDGHVRLAPFTRLPTVEPRPFCRGQGPIDVAPGKSVEQYLHDAFQAELFQSGVLASETDNAPMIIAQLEALELNTLGTGRWTIALRLTSSVDHVGFVVRKDFPFSTSWMANSACSNAAMAFGPAVNALIAQMISDPAFRRLVGH